MPRLLRLLLPLGLVLLAPTAIAAQGRPPSTPSPAAAATRVVRTLVYRELTAFTAGPNDGGEEAPLLSADGQSLAFARAPGAPDPAQPTRRISRIFVMAADGSGQHEVDTYPQDCYCGAAIALSADGSRVVSTDSVQLRLAEATGPAGRQLLILASNELNAVRLSGDGRTVFFRLRRDTTRVDAAPHQDMPRGIWAIQADGSGLRQLVGPAQLAAVVGVPVAQIPIALDTAFGLAVSADGAHVIFGAYYPHAGTIVSGLFAVNGDGSGVHLLVGPVSFVITAAISGDGTTVASTTGDFASGVQEVGVLPFGGGTARLLLTSRQRLPVANGGVPASGDRMQLSADGRWALLGSSGVLADTRTGELLALAVRSCCSHDAPPLVGDGLFRATMDRTARRFLYLSGDAKGVRQLARLDLNPADPGAAPRVTDVTLTPATIPQGGGTAATLTARVDGAPASVEVRSAVLGGAGLRGASALSDPEISAPPLVDDGTTGDTHAGDGIFTTNGVRADCCAVAGPRSVRVLAEAQGADGKRQAMAVDVVPFAVVGPGPGTPGTSQQSGLPAAQNGCLTEQCSARRWLT